MKRNMFVETHATMDHPCDHTINEPAVPLEEPVRAVASTSVSPDRIQAIQALASLRQDTSNFQVPSHSQHEDNFPQFTEEQKEEIMRMHTELTAQENPVKQISFQFEEPQDQTEVHNAIFKEPQDKADVYNAISGGEPQGEFDDSKSVSEEEPDQEEGTPQGKRKQERPIAKSNANSIEPQGSESISEEESDQDKEWIPKGEKKQGRPKPIAKSNANSTEPQEESDKDEEWTPQGKSKQGRSKSDVKRKYTTRNSPAKTQLGNKGS